MEGVPATSWFSTSEGIYTLSQFLTAPASLTTQPVTLTNPNAPPSNASSQSASTAPLTPNPDTPTPVIPPPQYPSRLAVTSIRFPASGIPTGGRERDGSGLAGLGMSLARAATTGGQSRRQEQSSHQSDLSSGTGATTTTTGEEVAPIPSPGLATINTSNLLGLGPTSPQLGSPIALPNSSSGNPPLFSPSSSTSAQQPPQAPRRKPLTSSFSIPTLSSLSSTLTPPTSSQTLLEPPTTNSPNPASSQSSSNNRPQRHFKGTSSSFIRSWEGLPVSQPVWRGICETYAGRDAVFGFLTAGKGLVWVELNNGRPKEPICKILFSSPITSISLSSYTSSPTQLDILLSFSTGDILYFDPMCAKYTRFNKSGVITSSPITQIQWLPASSSQFGTGEVVGNLFLTSHMDGTVIVWDKEREDWNGFVPNPVPTTGLGGEERKGMDEFVVTRQTMVDKKGVSMNKFNPISHWRVSKKAVTAFTFSPDLQHVATVGEDGCLRIIDAASETLLDTFVSYFGALISVAWSPDGRFIITGGQDDLCTIYAPLEQRLVARCQGHSSFVTGVAWDPWRSDEKTTRFLSVGEDCKVIVWDLSSAALSRPKAHGPYNRRHSAGSTLSLARRRGGAESSAALPLSTTERLTPSYHAAPRRSDVALLQPSTIKVLSTDIFTGLQVLSSHIVTYSRMGQVKVWERPPFVENEEEGGLLGLREEFAASTVAIDSRRR